MVTFISLFSLFLLLFYTLVNWGDGCFRSSGVDDEVVGSCLSWWVLPLAVLAAILETAVSTVNCSSVSLKKENSEACYHSITLHFILNESVKVVRYIQKFQIDNYKKTYKIKNLPFIWSTIMIIWHFWIYFKFFISC